MVVDSGATLGTEVLDGDTGANRGFTLEAGRLAPGSFWNIPGIFRESLENLSGATHSISLGHAVHLDGAMLPRDGLQGGGIALDSELPGFPSISPDLLVCLRARGGGIG